LEFLELSGTIFSASEATVLYKQCVYYYYSNDTGLGGVIISPVEKKKNIHLPTKSHLHQIKL